MSPNKTLYVREDDMSVWEQAEQYASATRQSVSLLVAAALRRFMPTDIQVYVDPEPGEPTFDEKGTPLLVYGNTVHGPGWELLTLEKGESPGVDDHFIVGDRSEVEQALAEARDWLRMLSSHDRDLDDIEVEVGDPRLTRVFTGRWLVWPDEDESRTGEDGYDAGTYWGVALTKRGAIAVYRQHVNEGFPPALDVYHDLDDAENDGLPADIAAQAAAEIGQERKIRMDI